MTDVLNLLLESSGSTVSNQKVSPASGAVGNFNDHEKPLLIPIYRGNQRVVIAISLAPSGLGECEFPINR